MEPYGNDRITGGGAQAQRFFQGLGIDRRRLLPDAQHLYDNFLTHPTLQNIHRLQAQIAGDANRVFHNFPTRYQRLRRYRDRLLGETQDYLRRTDPNALNTYNMGRQITRDLVSPYTANTTLEQVSRGVHPNVTPKQLTNAIKEGQRNIIYETEGGHPVTAIHPHHRLNNHLNHIENLMKLQKGFNYGAGLAGLAGAGYGADAIIRNYLNKNIMHNEGSY